MVFSSESAPSVTKELQFGQLMLKRARRELNRLDVAIGQINSQGGELCSLQAQYEQLRHSIRVFEQEIGALQSLHKCQSRTLC